jgi:hypothetical protein
MSENKIIERIEKLLRLAKNQSNTPEGETAAQMATKLMLAHAIEMSQIDLDKDRTNDPLVQRTFKCPKTLWTRQLGAIIGTHCYCKFAFRTWGSDGGVFYGYKSDTEVAVYLFDICKKQIERAARKHLKEIPEWDRFEAGKRFRGSAVGGLNHKLCRMREEEMGQLESDTYALVVNRHKQVVEWANDKFSFKSGNAGRSYSSSRAGYEAGKRVNVGRGIGGTTDPKQLRG